MSACNTQGRLSLYMSVQIIHFFQSVHVKTKTFLMGGNHKYKFILDLKVWFYHFILCAFVVNTFSKAYTLFTLYRFFFISLTQDTGQKAEPHAHNPSEHYFDPVWLRSGGSTQVIGQVKIGDPWTIWWRQTKKKNPDAGVNPLRQHPRQGYLVRCWPRKKNNLHCNRLKVYRAFSSPFYSRSTIGLLNR